MAEHAQVDVTAETMNESSPETEPDKENPQTEDQPVNTTAAPGSVSPGERVSLPAISPELAARSEANRQRALAKLDKEAKRAARKAADFNDHLVAQERASALEQ